MLIRSKVHLFALITIAGGVLLFVFYADKPLDIKLPGGLGVPASVALLIFGVLLFIFARQVISFVANKGWIKTNEGVLEQDIVEYLWYLTDTDQPADSTAIPVRIGRAAAKILRVKVPSHSEIKALLTDSDKRGRMSHLLGLSPHDLDMHCLSKDLRPAFTQMYHSLYSRVRANQIIVLSIGLIVPLLFVIGFITSYERYAQAVARNDYAKTTLYALLDNHSLVEDDIDDVRHFLDVSNDDLASDSIETARQMLLAVYPLEHSEKADRLPELRWDSAYTSFCGIAASAPQAADSSSAKSWWEEPLNWVGIGYRKVKDDGDVHLAAHLAALRAKICSRMTRYGTYGGDAVARMLEFYKSSRDKRTSGLAYNGLAIFYKFEIQRQKPTSPSLFKKIWIANCYLDSSLWEGDFGFFGRARFHNNKADLNLEIIGRCLEQGRLIIDRDSLRSMPTFCQMYWESIDKVCRTKNLLPLFDSVEYHLGKAADFYDSPPSSFIMTEAQFYSLKAAHLLENLNDEGAAGEQLDRALNSISYAISMGFRSPSVLYEDNRIEFYFGAFDHIAFDDKRLDLLTILTERFPNDAEVF